MVNRRKAKSIFHSAVAIFVIACLFFGNIAFAKKELNDEEVERIKMGLGLTKDFLNIVLNNNQLKAFLNTVFEGVEIKTDITYGLVALSALNEMDFIDMVVSQRFKGEAREYFNHVLDEKVRLLPFWKGVGADVAKIVFSGKITGPMSALALNTFSMTNEVVNIFIAFENLKSTKMYTGLWFYFDQRMNNTSHEESWSDARDEMGWASYSLGGFYRENEREKQAKQLENQFSELWERWGEYVDRNGIKSEIKAQAKAELREKFAKDIELGNFARIKPEPELSLMEKLKMAIEDIFNKIKALVKTDPFSPAEIVQSIEDGGTRLVIDNNAIEVKTQYYQEKENLEQIVEFENLPSEAESENEQKTELASQEEKIKTIDNSSSEDYTEEKEKSETTKEVEATSTEKLTKEEKISELGETEEKEEEEEIKTSEPQIEDKKETIWCERSGDPLHGKVVFNEIAWMGTKNSANDEWIELKNISDGSVNLDGWQIQDKGDQIKIAFEDGFTLKAGELALLERTDDGSVLDVEADIIYKGTLNNSDEVIYLFDNNCQLIDKASAIPKWLGGDNDSKRTMERKENLNWQTSESAGGTPKQDNGNEYIFTFGATLAYKLSAEEPSSEKEDVLEDINILITEVQIASASSSAEDFIELYNFGESDIDISNFQLKKRTSPGSEYSVRVFEEGSTIGAKGYFLWANFEGIADATSTQTLAKDNSLALFDKKKNIIDAVGWGSSTDPFFENIIFEENPDSSQNLARKWLKDSQEYLDTDNNQNDFELQLSTPKAENKTLVAPENQAPLAGFTVGALNNFIGQDIIFDSSSSTDADGEIVSYLWDFGDGNFASSSFSTSTHWYQSAGSFLVELIIFDDDNSSSSATSSVEINEETPSLGVVINEIAWAGTKANSADEWIELYNNTDDEIDLTGWSLNTSSGSPSFIFSTTTIASSSFYLMERTDDTAIDDVIGDYFYTGDLLNSGENLELRDENNRLIDVVDCSNGWFFGTSSFNYISMERINSNASSSLENWASNNLITKNGKDSGGNKIYGTPKAQNSISREETAFSNSNLDFDGFDNITLTKLGSPYTAMTNIIIPAEKTLIVEPEVVLRFYITQTYGPGDGASLKINGNLLAKGEEGKEIIFTSTGALWLGFLFEGTEIETTNSSFLDHIVIEKARSWESGIYSAIKIDKKMVSIKNLSINSYSNCRGIYLIDSNSTIEGSLFSNFNDTGGCMNAEGASAIYVKNGATIIKNNNFYDNSTGVTMDVAETCFNNSDFKFSQNVFATNSIPIYIASYGIPCFEGNSVLNAQKDNLKNIIDGIVLKRINIAQDTIWQSDLPFIIEGDVYVLNNATLTIPSLNEIKFKYSNSASSRRTLLVNSGANLLAEAEDDELISFTSAKENPSAGDWMAVRFESGSSGSLKNVNFSYGGFTKALNDCLVVNGANVSLENITKEFCNPY